MSSLLTYDNFVHALAGSVASGTAMSVFYPLDTVRSRLQLEEGRKSKNTLATMRDLVQEEGFLTLYRGLEPVLYSLFASGFVYFYSFHGIRRLTGEKTALKDLVIGAAAGAINVLTTTPLWVVNTRIKMQGAKVLLGPERAANKGAHSSKKTGKGGDEVDEASGGGGLDKVPVTYDCLTDGLVKIIQQEGVASLWSGTIPSLILVTNPAVQFMIFEMLKRNLKSLLDKKELSPFHIFALGAASKTVSTILSYPLQVVQSKKRHGSPEVRNKSMNELLAELIANGTLYKGMEAKLLQTVMTTALMFVFYERIYSFVTRVSKSI
uniref:Peroxisomal membrane protein PMP34 n=1 Tax=Aceria tosichella TaxID=561515 RepID=A0A6G1SJA7_9ACAR